MAGWAALALACSSGKTQSGSGGAGGNGGTSEVSDAAPTGSGGTPTGGSTTAPANTGGSGGTSDPRTGSGGTTAIIGSGGGPGSGGRGNGGMIGSGGRGNGGTVGSGGRTGSGGGAGGPTGGTTSGGGVTTKPDASAGGTSDASSGSGGTTNDGGAAVPSAGCGKTPPAAGRQNITVGGASREYILALPDNYDTNRPYRLVFGFHGAKYSDDWVATGKAPTGGVALSGPFFGIQSESAGSTIFVAPQASGTWGDGDLAFVDAMLAQFEAQLCIDTSRIFSVGFSMGAIMTIRLACARSNVFRAVAPMSGSLPSPCATGQPIAYWASHATNDQTIPIAQGQAARDEFVKRNHCGTQTSAPDANNCITYQDCDPGYAVTWCTFTGTSSGQNGHEPAPFAGPAIWKFLAPL